MGGKIHPREGEAPYTLGLNILEKCPYHPAFSIITVKTLVQDHAEIHIRSTSA